MKLFTDEQIKLTEKYLGGKTHLLEWMSADFEKCTRCNELTETTERRCGLCPDCRIDQIGK